jgi:hypothetical protein
VSLTVDVDSYVTLTEASAYLSARCGISAWDAADEPAREKALKQAARQIDRQPLLGRKADSTQALAFPRCYVAPPVPGSYRSDVITRWWCETDVPQAVKDAQCEEALVLLERAGSARLKLQREGVKGTSIGGLSETYGPGAGRGLLSQEARELLRPYLAGAVPIT